jgi:hypothetical protein
MLELPSKRTRFFWTKKSSFPTNDACRMLPGCQPVFDPARRPESDALLEKGIKDRKINAETPASFRREFFK